MIICEEWELNVIEEHLNFSKTIKVLIKTILDKALCQNVIILGGELSFDSFFLI